MRFVDAALRGVPQVGNLRGVTCYSPSGRPADFLPTLGFVTAQETATAFERIAGLERVPAGLHDLLPLFAATGQQRHGIVLCISDWFPRTAI